MGFAPAPFYCFEFDGESEFDVDLEFDSCIEFSTAYYIPARSLLLQSIQQRKRKYDSTPNVFKYC